MENLYFPVFYNITGWNICFFGAGTVAERRIKTLLKYSCHIFIISKEASEEIRKMEKKGKVVWIAEEIKEEYGKIQIEELLKKIAEQYSQCFSDRKEFSMIFACTNQRSINQEVYEYCRQKAIPVNTADCKEQSDFYFPGLLQWEDVVIGVTGSGKDHKKVKTVMNKLRGIFNVD